MYRKLNIKSIVLVFAVLLVIYVLIEIIGSGKNDRTFKSDLVEVVADEVNKIEIMPRVLGGGSINIIKEGGTWMVESEGTKYNANVSMPGSMVSELNNMKTTNLVATKKEAWGKYEVTDSLGTRVKLYNGNNVVADVVIGKFNYQPQKVSTYVRLSNDKEVYAVEGFLSMVFNRDLDAFRDQTVIKSNKGNWAKLTFSYPADSSFVLTRSGSNWLVDGAAADSSAVESFFSDISNLTNSSFAQNEVQGSPSHSLLIEGDNMLAPVKISGYYVDEKNFIFESSQNQGTFFNNINTAGKIFISPGKFVK